MDMRQTAIGILRCVPLAVPVLTVTVSAWAQQTGVSQQGNITTFTAPPDLPAAGARAAMESPVDFVNAKARALPIAIKFSTANADLDAIRAMAAAAPINVPAAPSLAGVSAGKQGSGAQTPVTLGQPAPASDDDSAAVPLAFGSSGLPFSTARADLNPQATNDQYPYRASGKLFFNIENDTFICSASLINKGIVVTAAHCVSEFGQSKLFSNWHFVPGYRNGFAPFGDWTVAEAYVPTAYFEGTDICDPNNQGIVCQDDVAILVLNPKSGTTAPPSTPAPTRAGTALAGTGPASLPRVRRT